MPKVLFPCDIAHWWVVKDKLHELKDNCLEKEDFDLRDIAEYHQIIVDTVQGISRTEHLKWGETIYYGLVKYFQKHATADEKSQFVKITFPSIVELGLELEALLPTDGIDINEQQKGETKEIGRQLCCSIVACAFLCLFPVEESRRGRGSKLNVINFNKFFANLPISSQNAKLRCILHFFDRVSAEKTHLTGALLFTRQVIKWEELPTLDTWLNCTSRLCEVIVFEEGLIEDAGCNTLEVDFANRYIGGGVLGRGRVQEEIRFTVCPELIVSMLFMECMDDNEAIIIQGYEQFSAVQGYASDLRFAGEHRDSATRDQFGNLKNMLCAIDAISYRHDKGGGLQYGDHHVLRDLNKAFAGFCTPFTIPSSDSGRSLSVESYVTAKESEENMTPTEEKEFLYNQQIDVFVEELLHGALSLAIADASKTISRRENQSELPPNGNEHYLHRQSSMDHLEVNFRDWYANYRRRSSNLSNLSDLSSRRSSYDLASRRSSACSARGYSSEYSSEFEEYYDNFQQQEQRYKYHTIAEEVGSSAVNEFASSLAASLLKQGAEEASVFGPQVFHGNQPSYAICRPMPVRISTGSLSTVDSVENEEAIVREDCIRQYVDIMFENVWPFNEKETEKESCIETNKEMKQRILGRGRDYNLNMEECDRNFRREEQKLDAGVDDSERIRDSVEIKMSEETFLMAVADRIVAIAFHEALLEYQYLMCSQESNIVHRSFSESSQSEHSIENKDQSDSRMAESSQSVIRKNSNSDSAVMIAEKMLSGLFSKKESDLPPSYSAQKSAVINQSNIPEQEICDTNLKVVYSTSPKAHSSSSEDNELSASKRREMYSRIADNILFSGLTTKDSDDRLMCNEMVTSSLNLSSDSSQSDSSIGRQTLSISPAHCDLKEISSQMKSLSPNKLSGLRKSSSSSESRSSDSKSSDAVIRVAGSEGKRLTTLSPKKHHATSSQSEKKAAPPLFNQKSSENSDQNKSFDTRLTVHKEVLAAEDVSFDGSASGLSPHSGSKTHTGTKGNKLFQMPTHQARLALKPGRFFVSGNKKNYDQFANSLSRDLLTNAFLQVQEHNEPVAYPRRSSEPMQISNGAALQRYEHSFHIVNGRRSQKSKTDEDISQFDDEWLQQYSSRSSSGFRDPVLSRFAEELMKANVSVPPLQLTVAGDAISISSSSHSVCSTISSFRDPLLASFEEELLTSADKKSAKTRTSWSKARGSMCSPRLSCGNSTSSSSREGRKQLGLSMSVDSEASGVSYKSNNASYIKSVSDYAEMLSRRITCEALTVIYRSASSSDESDQERAPISLALYSDMLAASILKSALMTSEVIEIDMTDQNKVVTWSEETKCVHYSDKEDSDDSDKDTNRERAASLSESCRSSTEYEDALDIPYKRLEEFADVLASKVLINSVAISRREYMCSLRRQHGRPIATGNWGCGAFGGDPHLKSLIQWMAASYAGCPAMLYYTFRNPQMSQFQTVVSTVLERGWDVSKLMQVVRRYCISAENEINEHGFISRELFDIILQGEIFPGV